MKIIVVSSEKGGVGKTTIACGLASICAHRGLRTLLVDLDPQGNAGYAVGARLDGCSSADFIARKKYQPQAVAENIHVLVGGPSLRNADIQNSHPDVLGIALRKLTGELDIIIVDTPPGELRLVQMGLSSADEVVVPICAHPFAIQGAQRIVDQVGMFPAAGKISPRVTLVMSLLDLRKRDDRELEGALELLFPGVPRTAVPLDATMAGSGRDQIVLMDTAPKARGTLALLALADLVDITRLERTHVERA